MKETKKLRQMFAKYGVVLRRRDSTVVHAVKRTESTLTPLQFGVYELALKAVDAGGRKYRMVDPNGDLVHPQADAWNKAIADKDGFSLLADEEVHAFTPHQHAEVYHYSCRLLGNDGLYYALLD